MKIKKNLTYLAALALVASLTACGGDDGPNDGFNPNPNPNPDAGQVDPNPGGDTGGNGNGGNDNGGGNNDAGNNGGGNDNGGWDDNGNGDDGTDIGGDFIIPENGSIPVEMVEMDAEHTCGIPNFAQEMMRQINAFRAQGRVCGFSNEFKPGAPALQAWNVKLQVAAELHSEDMAENNFMSHTGSDGGNLRSRLEAADVNLYENYYAENLVKIPFSYKGAESKITTSINVWGSSTQGHCEAVMHPVFEDFAASCVQSKSTGDAYVTLLLLGKN